MNNRQRKRLALIREQIAGFAAEVSEMAEEEQAKLDNAPENFSGSGVYQDIEDAIERLEELASALEDVDGSFDDVSL